MTWLAVIGLTLFAYFALSLFVMLVIGPLLERVGRHYPKPRAGQW